MDNTELAGEPPPSPPSRSAAGVRSVERALGLLNALTDRRSAGLVELANATGLSPSTAHRLLATLGGQGYVARDADSGRFRLGHRALAMAHAADEPLAALRAAASTAMSEVRDQFDETTNLVVLDDRAIVYLDQAESSRPVRMFSRIGNRVPAHASGAGKAILAHRPQAELEALLNAKPLERLTDHTITDPAALQAELATIRTRGYARDNEEYDQGVSCVAAPILRDDGTALAAFSISGPTERMRRIDADLAGRRLQQAARAVAARL